MEFFDVEAMGAKGLQEFFPEGFVDIDIIVQQNGVAVDGADHSVGMAEDVVGVAGDEADFAFELFFQPVGQIPFRERVLFHDFVGHDDAVREFDDVAAVDDEVCLLTFQAEAAGDGLVGRNVFRIFFQIVGGVAVLKVLARTNLDGHEVPDPHVLAGLGMPKEVCVDAFAVQRFQQIDCQGHIMSEAVGEIDGIGFTVDDHDSLLLILDALRVEPDFGLPSEPGPTGFQRKHFEQGAEDVLCREDLLRCPF